MSYLSAAVAVAGKNVLAHYVFAVGMMKAINCVRIVYNKLVKTRVIGYY